MCLLPDILLLHFLSLHLKLLDKQFKKTPTGSLQDNVKATIAALESKAAKATETAEAL